MGFLSRLGAVKRKTNVEGTLSSYFDNYLTKSSCSPNQAKAYNEYGTYRPTAIQRHAPTSLLFPYPQLPVKSVSYICRTLNIYCKKSDLHFCKVAIYI